MKATLLPSARPLSFLCETNWPLQVSFFPRWNCKGCWFLTVQTIKSNSKLATVLRRFSNIKVTPRSSYTWIIYHYQTRHWYVYASALRSRIQQQKMMITLLYNLTKEWVSKVCNVLWCWSDQEISLLIQFDTDNSTSLPILPSYCDEAVWIHGWSPRARIMADPPHSLRLFLFAHHIRSNFHRHSLVSWVVARRCLLLGMFVVQLSSPKT